MTAARGDTPSRARGRQALRGSAAAGAGKLKIIIYTSYPGLAIDYYIVRLHTCPFQRRLQRVRGVEAAAGGAARRPKTSELA